MAKLPVKLSAGIIAALEDLAYVRARPKQFHVDMGTWYERIPKYDENGNALPGTEVCTVCLGGSVIACRLNGKKLWDEDRAADPEENFSPDLMSLLSDDDESKIRALDSIREGDLQEAIDLWYGGDLPTKFANLNIEFKDRYHTYYESDYRGFKTDLQRAARDLAAVGL